MQNVSVPGVNFLVVGPGELKRTPKLTVGVALGKYVVEDQWLIDSKEVGYFLGTSSPFTFPRVLSDIDPQTRIHTFPMTPPTKKPGTSLSKPPSSAGEKAKTVS